MWQSSPPPRTGAALLVGLSLLVSTNDSSYVPHYIDVTFLDPNEVSSVTQVRALVAAVANGGDDSISLLCLQENVRVNGRGWTDVIVRRLGVFVCVAHSRTPTLVHSLETMLSLPWRACAAACAFASNAIA